MTTLVKDRKDRFGNLFSPGLPYARGSIIATGPDEHIKLARARAFMAGWMSRGGEEALYNLSGLERGMSVQADHVYNDETTPAIYGERLARAALEHLGGTAGAHDIFLANRQSAALFAALMVMVQRDDRVVGVSADYTHPAITRPVALLGAEFVDTTSLDEFESALAERSPRLVVLTRLAVSYRVVPIEIVQRVIEIARAKGASILVDDAGGARVGPAIFAQPKMLELDIDVGSTGLDKYGTVGPRLGLLGGKKGLVAEIGSRAYEYGLEARPMLYPASLFSLEQYRPERVHELRDCTARFGSVLKRLYGDRVQETPVSVQIPHEDVLEIAMQRANIAKPTIAPYEATAAVAMLLLRDYGVLTVHFAGLPPGTSGLLFKFMSPETMERFGGRDKLAGALDAAIDQLSEMLPDPAQIAELLLG
jgi:L-seryl-tRNA(Ser) seleniumtransferase